MKIYLAHSKSFDFEKELYEPIKNSALAKEHTFIFPHADNDEPFDSKKLFQEGLDLVVAEVSYPATGLGIELGWANSLGIPIACIYKKDTKISGSLTAVTDTFWEYSDLEDLVVQIEKIIKL